MLPCLIHHEETRQSKNKGDGMQKIIEQRSGMVGELELNNFEVDEQAIIRRLSKVWYVSFAKEAFFKGSRYPYVFLKPTSLLAERFNLYTEVLCLFHSYPTFDARALDFVDKTLVDFNNRLDKLCVVVISKSSSIHKEIEKLSVDKESRIYIPFSNTELCGGNEDTETTVIKRLEKQLYTKDLFAFDSPLRTDKYFFGRKADVQALVGKYSNGENGCIFGLRRIGKTSVLLAVERELKGRECPVVYIDCSDTKFHRNRWNTTLFHIKCVLFKHNGLSDTSGHKEAEYTEGNASQCFVNDLRKLSSIHKKKPILLIFDEVESLTFELSASEHWAGGLDYVYFWQTIRSAFQQNSGLFSFIISGVNPRALESPRVSEKLENPIYRFITPNYLGFFDVEQVAHMVSYIGKYMGLRFAKEVETYLTDDFGGHPFLIRQICSQIHRHASAQAMKRPMQVSKEFYKAHISKFSQNISEYIELILQILVDKYPHEYELLLYLANDDKSTFLEFASQSKDWIIHLEGYGLIKEDANNYHFRINIVRDVIKAKSSDKRLPNSLEERWAVLSEKRNSFEKELKEKVRTLLKILLASDKAKAEMLTAMQKPSQKSKALSFSYEEIFSGELYLLDLKRVIENNWKIFENIFRKDKEKFIFYMDYVNKHRSDAHAKDIKEDDFAVTLAGLTWLNDCLSTNT